MKKAFIYIVTLLIMAVSIGMSACAKTPDNGGTEIEPNYSHEFTEQVKSWTGSTNSKYGVSYCKASAVYCTNPTHPGSQSLALYAPAEYLNNDGSLNKTAKVGNFTATTAPIIYWSSHGSGMGMGPYSLNGASTSSTQYGWAFDMIKEGFVVCMVGERGRTSKDENGNIVGRGPVAIADLKAGVRFLKHNNDVIPGNAERIIAAGLSSGGGMIATLGVSGNNPYYDSYLKEMGAGMDETDDIFATQAYAPAIDLSHTDFAYEWVYGQDTKDMTEFEKALSNKLAFEFASYFNSLELKDDNGTLLSLATDGSKSGTFYDYLVKKYEASFEDYAANYDSAYKGFVLAGNNGASDADTLEWLEYNSESNKATLVTPEGYDSALDAIVLSGFCTRAKGCTSHDTLNLASSNELFGAQGAKADAPDAARHYNQRIAEIIDELKDEFPEEYAKYYQAFYDDSHNTQVIEWLSNIDSNSYLTGGAEGDISPNFRITLGTQDAEIPSPLCAMMELQLKQKGKNAQFDFIWGWGHKDADTPTGLIDWVKSICK